MFTLNCKGRLLALEQPVVMGILNITPDSFYAGSRTATVSDSLKAAEKMLTEGATLLDIGGQSTRPGSIAINEDEELKRVLPIIESVRQHFPSAFISIDTYRANVAKQAVQYGADIVNDISGGSIDEMMMETVALLKAPYICMHIKGMPETMQQQAVYENVTKEVLDYFIKKTDACRKAGIHDMIIDPGFGFAKTITHNFELLNNLDVFKMLERPVLLGVSRKSTIYKTLGITAEEALNGSTVLHTIGLMKGANILRVHDVKEAVEAIKLVSRVIVVNENN